MASIDTTLLASALSTIPSRSSGDVTPATSMIVRSGSVQGMFRSVTMWTGKSLGRCTSPMSVRLELLRATVTA